MDPLEKSLKSGIEFLDAITKLKKGSDESKMVQKALGYKSNAKLHRDIKGLNEMVEALVMSMGEMMEELGEFDEFDDDYVPDTFPGIEMTTRDSEDK